MTKPTDATHMLTWDEDSLRALDLEVATASVEHGSVNGYGPGKVWELSATFRGTGARSEVEAGRQPAPFALKVSVLDEVGVELDSDTNPTLRGKGPFQGTTSGRVVTHARSAGANKRVRHLVASVFPSAPHPDEPPLEIQVDVDRALMSHAGLDLKAVRAIGSARSWGVTTDVVINVRATVDPSATAVLDVMLLDDGGFPIQALWGYLSLAPDPGDPSVPGVSVGAVSIDSPVLPQRVILTPVFPGVAVQAAALLDVDDAALDHPTDLVASAASVAGQPETVTIRVSGTISSGPERSDEISAELALFVEVMNRSGRVMSTETVHLPYPTCAPMPVAIEFSIFRADRHEEPTTVRLSM